MYEQYLKKSTFLLDMQNELIHVKDKNKEENNIEPRIFDLFIFGINLYYIEETTNVRI